MLRPGRVDPPTDHHESARYWSRGFFYLKDASDPASERMLPPFKNSPASETSAWTQCPHLSESPLLTRAVRRICKLTEEGLTGKDLTMSWFTKRIQPLQHQGRLMFHYTGCDDPMRASKDNLSADAIDKRIRLLIKIPRDLHIHVCNKDIHTSGSGTALEALEEGDLGTLLRVPHTGNTDPEAASEAEAPEVPRPSKRKRLLPPALRQTCPRRLASPPVRRRRRRSASSSSTPEPSPTTSTSSSAFRQKFRKPAPQGPKKRTSHLRLPYQSHQKSRLPHPSPSLQKLPLSQRHAEVSAMMDKVWGPANTEMKELSDLESDLKVFFAKHKDVRQLHEDLRVHVLEQLTEIEGLRQNAENSQSAIKLLETRLNEIAKRPAIDDLFAKVQVLEAENESLKNFLKETSEKETSAKKELSEKHARDMAELSDKLKKSQQRVSTLAAKIKSQEAEVEAIDKMIFPSLGFEWTKESTLKRTEAYDEARSSIDDLVEACRGIAKSLSLKRAKTTVIDTMTKVMKQVPELIKDWQESSARGVASLVLATAKRTSPP
ncbi:hypothetical protein QYE76_049060 [Lolium multiflorum]|uniref:Uncharacterized protein n=1 Tax=Lolium multiflorum TaxID=4521 RepID=A0AAD8SMC5_LOLMU|nr:hypothetical protein QYE76_049060 [Lolium multiflorum]